MDFVIQYNMLNNEQLLKVKDAVEGLPHKFVGLIPFSREITSDYPIVGTNHIPYGSTSFVETALELGWEGLSFDVERFDYQTAAANRDDMLNGEHILPTKSAIWLLSEMDVDADIFIKPAHDLKQFTGAIYKAKEAADFLKDAMEFAGSGSYKIAPDLPIVVAFPQNILVEWRWFIVGGKVIDGSMYRRNGQMHKEHVLTLDSYKIKAQDMANGWLAASNCVMDTCLLKDGSIKIVEFNCINGSGFYDHDRKKIMTEWWKYHNES